MAVDINLRNSNSLTNIATNFERVEAALQETLSRNGTTPNSMNADIDLNGNDLLNVNIIEAEDINIDGVNLSTRLEEVVEARDIAVNASTVAVAASNIAVTKAAEADASSTRALENATQLVIASKAQAEAGSINDKGMTPLRTKEAIWYNNEYLTPEMFGAALTGNPAVDEKAIIDLVLDAGVAQGRPIWLRRLYYTSGNIIGGTDKGYAIYGPSGVHQRRGSEPIGGFAPVADNQEYLIRLGTVSGENATAIVLDGITFHGSDYNFTKGMLYSPAASQIRISNCSFRRARAPGLYSPRIEDGQIINCQFTHLGGNDGRAALCFGSLVSPSTIGNNALYIRGGRFEYIDGPHIGIDPSNGTTAWASSVFIQGVKFESGDTTTSFDGPDVTYGSFRENYYLFDFGRGDANRITVRFSDYFISRASEALAIARIGSCDDFIMEDGTYSGTSINPVRLLHIQDDTGNPVQAQNVIFRRHTIREVGGGITSTRTFEIINKNEFPIIYELPLEGPRFGALILSNDRRDNLIYASETSNSPTGFGGVTAGNRCITDPDPVTDPCYSVSKSVLARYGNSSNGTAIPLLISSLIPNGNVGYQFLPSLYRVRIRAKKELIANSAGLRIVQGGTLLNTVSITTDTWAWYTIDFDASALTTGDICIGINNNDNVSQITYIDAYTIERLNHLAEVSVSWSVPNIVNATQSSTTVAVTGSVVGDLVQVFPPTIYSASGGLQGLHVWGDVTVNGTVTVYLSNLTGGAIDLATGSFKVRVTRR